MRTLKLKSRTAIFLRNFAATLALLLCATPLAKVTADENAQRFIRLATTTSTDNSGLLEYLLPMFERESGYRVQVISVGTGKALRLGENGDVDALLVHAPASERRFIEHGHGVNHRTLMENDFVFAGPRNDPSQVRAAKTLHDALRNIRRGGTAFISRGDDSGTHKKEMQLWRAANIDAGGNWRLETGRGMSASLQIAEELQAYIFIDRATWLFAGAQTTLQLLHQGGAELRNPYGVIAVNPARHRVNFAGANALIQWLVSPRAQNAIGAYRIGGAQLFTPAANAP